MDPDPNFSWIDPDPKSRQTIKILFFLKTEYSVSFCKIQTHFSGETFFYTGTLSSPNFFFVWMGKIFFFLPFLPENCDHSWDLFLLAHFPVSLLFVGLSVCLRWSAFLLTICLSVCLSVCAFAYTVYLPAIWGLPLDPPPVLSVCLSAYTSLPSVGYLPPAPPPVLFVCLSVYLSFYLSVCLCFCLPPCHLLAAYTSSSSATVLSICLSVLLHIPPCHLLSTYLQLLRLFVCLSVCAFTYTSLPSVGYLLLAPPPVRLSVCLCFCIYLPAICWLTIAPLPGLSVYPFVCLAVLLPTSLPYVGYLPKAPPPVLSVYVSVCLSALLHIPPCHLLATYL